MATPSAELAAKIREAITRHPEDHDPASNLSLIALDWFDDPHFVLESTSTTLNVAGYAVHFAGGKLHYGKASANWLGCALDPDEFAAAELKLRGNDAEWLFSPERSHEEVCAALGLLAADAPRLCPLPTACATVLDADNNGAAPSPPQD